MAIKLKFGNRSSYAGNRGSLKHRMLRGLLIAGLACLFVGTCVFGFCYFKYKSVVDDRIAAGPLFANSSQVYAAPREVRVGQHLTAALIAEELSHAGYNTNPQLGTYTLSGDRIQIKPGPESFHSADGATITTGRAAVAVPVASDDSDASSPSTGSDASTTPATPKPVIMTPTYSGDPVVLSITADNGAPLAAYQLEPQLITALSQSSDRTKRRLVSYKDIPPQLVQAVTAIEDRRFFEHGGVNYLRIAKCAVADVVSHHKECGGSTLTMQLARGFFLTPEKKFTRKVIEIMITFQLEARFNKQQIFEMYANQIPLGQRGSFGINGFGEASETYFGKDLRHLDLAECAMLAGMIQRPSYFNPYHHLDRVMERRNLVLDSMVETDTITRSQADRAKAEPIKLTTPNIDASEAPYFVDLVHDEITKRVGDQELGHDALRIYTSLDPELQRAATEAVEASMKAVDAIVLRQHKKGDTNITYPQVALIALNPHTGQILALVGGRNYGGSQLNHATAERPTGSIFKPFVYAAAYNTSLNSVDLGGNGVFTALTRLNDDPRTFMFDGKPYDPGNFEKGEYPGMVTAATALAHSLNIATIGLAEQVGYENVAALARSAGIVNARGTPSAAIGTYNATPIDMAGAYTVFANNGVHLKPWMVASVRNANGDVVADFAPEAKQVLDPRTAYLTQSLMQGAMNFGTAAVVRGRGFSAPAAGKTGTSHDAWFAGYTSNLLCIIWVGNDDYTNLNIEGAKAAAPIWAEFMNRAIKLPQYSDMHGFSQPEGVQNVSIDKTSWLPADDSCPVDYSFAFLDGTVPGSTCSHMGGESTRNFVQKLFGIGGSKPPQTASPPQ